MRSVLCLLRKSVSGFSGLRYGTWVDYSGTRSGDGRIGRHERRWREIMVETAREIVADGMKSLFKKSGLVLWRYVDSDGWWVDQKIASIQILAGRRRRQRTLRIIQGRVGESCIIRHHQGLSKLIRSSSSASSHLRPTYLCLFSHYHHTHLNMQCTRRLLAPPGFWKRSLQEFSRLSGIGTYFCSRFLLYHPCCFS